MLKKYVGDAAFYKTVLAVAVPIMLQNGITNLVNMLDNIMVGAVGTVQMSGAAIANQLLFIFNLCIFGAVSGAGIFGTQFYGKGDWEGVRYTFRFKYILCACLTAAGIAVFLLLDTPLISLYTRGEGSAADAAAITDYARRYLWTMLPGLLPYALAQCYASTLRESGETVLPMQAGIAAVAVNLALNYVLIFGHFGAPAMGVTGAAAATVVSRFAELAIVAVWTWRHRERFPFITRAFRSLRMPLHLTGRILSKGLPLMLNEALWAVGIAALNQCYSVRGLEVVAATNISQTFWNLFSVCFMAVGTAIGIIIGQLLGAGELETVRDTNRRLIVFSLMVSVVVGGIYALLAGYIPLLYHTTDEVRHLAAGLMRIAACTMPISAFCHASYFTIRSGGNVTVTFLMDSCFTCLIAAPTAFCLSRFTALPILGLFLAVQLMDLIKCAVGFVLLKKGLWIRNMVTDA